MKKKHQRVRKFDNIIKNTKISNWHIDIEGIKHRIIIVWYHKVNKKRKRKLISFFELMISAFFLTLQHIISQGKSFFFNFYKFNKRLFFSLFSIKNI